MAEYALTKAFDVPVQQVWAVASDPANLARWLPTAHRSAPQGGQQVELAGESHGHRYDVSAPLRVDEAAHRLSWSAPDGRGYEGSLDVRGEGERTELTVHLSLSDELPAAGRGQEVERGMAEALEALAAAAR